MIHVKNKQVVSQPQCNILLRLLPARPHHRQLSCPHRITCSARPARTNYTAAPIQGVPRSRCARFGESDQIMRVLLPRVACFLTEIRGYPEGYRAAFTPRWDVLSEFHPGRTVAFPLFILSFLFFFYILFNHFKYLYNKKEKKRIKGI